MIDCSNCSDLDSTTMNDVYVYARTTHRVRKALFPDILIEDDLNNDDYALNPSSVVGQFAEPSQVLKAAILDLLMFKDQLDEVTGNIPHLIAGLCNPDQAVVSDAAHKVYLLSKEDRCIASLASDANLVGALVGTLNAPNVTAESKKDAIASLSHISHYDTGRMHIFRSGGIAELIRMLYSGIESTVHYAVTTLHNLLLHVVDAKNEIIVNNGLQAFVPLLAAHNSKLQALVADCLYFLLLDNAQCKQAFLSLQGPYYLVSILKSDTSYIKLIYAVVRCIRSISTDQQNKASLISLNALEALHQIMPSITESKRRLAVLNAMRNLSDVATNLNTLTDLVVYLVALINSDDNEDIISCACGILSNLTCNNVPNKQAVYVSRGIPILANVLDRFRVFEDITEPALCTLRHCTVRHQFAQQAQDELQFAHPTILTLLATRRPPIVKAALGLVRNCALSQLNLQTIISLQTTDGDTVVTIAAEILENSGIVLQQDFNGVTDGVSLLEMVEGAISALHQLAKDVRVAQFIYTNHRIMSILVNLMANSVINNNEDELMMREIMGLLYQLTKTPEGAKTVKLCGTLPHITDALNSSHKSIAAYAMIILKNMGIEKDYGADYLENPYSTGTMNSNRMGSANWQNDGMEPELYNELHNFRSLNEHDHNEGFDTDV